MSQDVGLCDAVGRTVDLASFYFDLALMGLFNLLLPVIFHLISNSSYLESLSFVNLLCLTLTRLLTVTQGHSHASAGVTLEKEWVLPAFLVPTPFFSPKGPNFQLSSLPDLPFPLAECHSNILLLLPSVVPFTVTNMSTRTCSYSKEVCVRVCGK